MALAPGTRLGPYEITALIGAGGMGEVYRARDTKLNRDVALKILPEAFAIAGDRIARFRREAQVLAALNHPHIAAIYGFEDSCSTHALVLELVEGPTLADRIAKGAIPLDEALPIAQQIAEALEAAHEQGIIHRDLKPANIKLRDDGSVKVLDFGLAKAMDAPAAISPMLTASPTITTPAQMTGLGMILGTAAYMSPEQAKGRPADKRSDVWAFGCVLYEMLTGKHAFEGDDVSDTLASILKGEPNWAALPSLVPSRIHQLLRRCLRRDSSRRLQAIGEARIVIADVLGGQPDDVSGSQSAGVRSSDVVAGWHRATAIAVGAVVTAALAGAVWWRFWPQTAPVTVMRFSISLAQDQSLPVFTNTGRQVLALSQDGTQLVYTANQRLYLRTMGDLNARPIPGIDGSFSVINPVFSPDGRSIVFWSGGDRTLKQIGVAGGAAVTIATVTTPVGMSWSSDGILLGQLTKGIVRLGPHGGTPDLVVSTKSDEVAHGPQMLPGGKAVLFTLAKATTSLDRWDHAQIVVQSLSSGERKVLIDGGGDARYVPTGHLVYAVGGVVLAVPFDARRLEVSGAPVPIVEGVMRATGAVTGTAQFSVAANGSLAYVPGPVSVNVADRALALLDRKGTATSLKLQPGAIEHPRLSPDGRRVAFVIGDDKTAVVSTYELSGETSMKRVTYSGRNRFPIWADGGKRLVFQSDRDGDRGIWWQLADGTGAPQRLTTADKDTEHVPESWSPKDDGFLFRITKGDVNTLWFFSLKEQKAIRFGAVQSVGPTNATFSPDGQWVAYETRTNALGSGLGVEGAIYVQPFPATQAIYQLPAVERGGYRHPHWSPNGKELFFIIGGNVRLRVVSVKTQPDFIFGNAESLPKPGYWLDNANDNATQWDVLSDGQHFIINALAASVGQPDSVGLGQQIHLVLNWFEELKQRVPAT